MNGTGKTDTHPILAMDTANMIYRGTTFKGIFISDKIFMVADSGEKTHVKEWLKSVIKEAVEEVIRGEEHV